MTHVSPLGGLHDGTRQACTSDCTPPPSREALDLATLITDLRDPDRDDVAVLIQAALTKARAEVETDVQALRRDYAELMATHRRVTASRAHP